MSDNAAVAMAIVVLVAIMLWVTSESRQTHNSCRDTFTAEECIDIYDDGRPSPSLKDGF